MTPDPLDRFDEELRRWSRTPPETPAREAAEAVARRLEALAAPKARPVRPARPWLRAAAVLAAAMLAVVGALAFWFGHPAPPQPSPEPAASPLPEVLPENVALIWLDTETPLYLTLPELNLE
jgi:ferric-dicitrate binding protein FerR (iron transport regulator)